METEGTITTNKNDFECEDIKELSSNSTLESDEYNYILKLSEGEYNPLLCQPTCLHHIFESTVQLLLELYKSPLG